MSEIHRIHWTDGDAEHTVRWRSETGMPRPVRVVPADDRLSAATAHRLACEGTALLWQGDFQQARQMLRAMARRIDRKSPAPAPAASPTAAFHLHRRAAGHRARVLAKLLVPLGEDHTLGLRRAPDVRAACEEAYGPPRGDGPWAVPLRELLGVIGAHQWRTKGVDIPAIGARIHPHYGVFSPVRGEYVDLVARAPLPAAAHGARAFDLGTGTGVLAAVLAHRGVRHVVATDSNPRAAVCAADNMNRLGLTSRVEIATGCGLYPPGRAALVVCNPPWLPARPNSALEQGVYDPAGTMLHGFLSGLADHLLPGGEGWLIMSDLAEHLGLRSPGELRSAITAAGLHIQDRLTTRPRHRRPTDPADPLHKARAAEVTSLWRLRAAR